MKEEKMLYTIKVFKNYDIEQIKKEIKNLPNFKSQIYLQGYKKDMDPFYGIGYKGSREIDRDEANYKYNLFDKIPYINKIINENKLVRTRIMILKKKECYTWHDDNSERWHIPIQSGNGAFFCFNNGMVYLPPDGSLYKVDTRRWHTAINGTAEDRIHIVGAPSQNHVFTEEFNKSPFLNIYEEGKGIREFISCNDIKTINK